MTTFDGQQEGERVLYVIAPHPFTKQIAIARLVFLALFLYAVFWVIGSIVPSLIITMQVTGFVLSVLLLVIGVWWNLRVFSKARAYITDRRIIRFDVVSPFFTTKRALFWSEALKAKAYSPNFFLRSMKIGTIDVEPQLSEGEDVRVTDVYYFEDLANYIDKILFIFKNAPSDIVSLKPFIPKDKGQRDISA